MAWRMAAGSLALLALLGCGPDAEQAAETVTSAGDDAFCSAWAEAVGADADDLPAAVGEDPPPELAEALAVLREADPDDRSPAVEAAGGEVLRWVTVNCSPGDGRTATRVAPPAGADLGPLEPCLVSTWPTTAADPADGGLVLFGDADSPDPYTGDMLGLAWGPADDAGHAGDGDLTPVTVRGQEGVAAPITVFQQTILPELGTVVAWDEGGRALGLYGRGWGLDEVDALLTVAEGVEPDGDGLTIDPAVLPDGFAEVHAGTSPDLALLVPASGAYEVHYEGGGGTLTLYALDPAGGEAFRFLTTGVEPAELGGRQVLAGDAWYPGGPHVVSWTEPGGPTVRVVGIGTDPELVRRVAEASRPLDDDEWAALVEATSECAPA